MSVLRFRRWPGIKHLTAAILVVGFGSAIAIYFAAGPTAENPLGYNPLDTKTYIHDMELYGGKANVLAEEFREWFVGLWQGRTLAYTVAVLTVLLALAVRFVAKLRRARRAIAGAQQPASRILR